MNVDYSLQLSQMSPFYTFRHKYKGEQRNTFQQVFFNELTSASFRAVRQCFDSNTINTTAWQSRFLRFSIIGPVVLSYSMTIRPTSNDWKNQKPLLFIWTFAYTIVQISTQKWLCWEQYVDNLPKLIDWFWKFHISSFVRCIGRTQKRMRLGIMHTQVGFIKISVSMLTLMGWGFS